MRISDIVQQLDYYANNKYRLQLTNYYVRAVHTFLMTQLNYDAKNPDFDRELTLCEQFFLAEMIAVNTTKKGYLSHHVIEALKKGIEPELLETAMAIAQALACGRKRRRESSAARWFDDETKRHYAQLKKSGAFEGVLYLLIEIMRNETSSEQNYYHLHDIGYAFDKFDSHDHPIIPLMKILKGARVKIDNKNEPWWSTTTFKCLLDIRTIALTWELNQTYFIPVSSGVIHYVHHYHQCIELFKNLQLPITVQTLNVLVQGPPSDLLIFLHEWADVRVTAEIINGAMASVGALITLFSRLETYAFSRFEKGYWYMQDFRHRRDILSPARCAGMVHYYTLFAHAEVIGMLDRIPKRNHKAVIDHMIAIAQRANGHQELALERDLAYLTRVFEGDQVPVDVAPVRVVAPITNIPTLSTRQNTHTKSVHASVSTSVADLSNYYATASNSSQFPSVIDGYFAASN